MLKLLDAGTALRVEYINLPVEAPTDNELIIITREYALLDLVSGGLVRDSERSRERVVRKGVKVKIVR